MPAPESVVQAVEGAIASSAYLAAYEHVSAAAQACQRLGTLTSGRWRSAGRDLARLEEDLQTAFAESAEALTAAADELGVPEDALWTIGDAAGTLDLLRESALETVDEAGRAAKLLGGRVLFGASFVENPDLPDRGTTLLFGWPEPLSPATWPWQANWVVGDGQDDGEQQDELDLYESGEMQGEDSLLADLAEELACSPQDARVALREAALALTRASLLAGAGDDDQEADEDQEDEHNHSGERLN